MHDDSDEIIEQLILEGSIEIAGIDSATGQFVYSFTKDAKEKNPGLYNSVQEDFYNNMMYLWQNGIIEMDISSDNPLVKPTAKIYDKQLIESLPLSVLHTLHYILDAMSR